MPPSLMCCWIPLACGHAAHDYDPTTCGFVCSATPGPLRWNDDVHEVGSCLDLGDSFGQLWAWDCLNVRLKAGKQT